MKILKKQLTKFMTKLIDVPLAVSGLAAGVTGIGAILAIEYNYIYAYIASGISAVLLLLILFRKITYPRQFLQELRHPVAGSLMPAFDMALMVISANIAVFCYKLGLILWTIAVIIHLLFLIIFLYFRLQEFNLNHMLPSWFIPPVGIVVAALTGNFIHNPLLIQNIFYGGFVLYLLLLPIMLYRIIFGDKIPDHNLPAFAAIASPASLCLAGYLAAFVHPNIHMVNFLLPLSLMMTVLVYISMFRINAFRIKFIPIYATFTFPLAMGANAILRYSKFIGTNHDFALVWHTVAICQMWIAVIVTIWVFINIIALLFIIFYLKK
jgi:exfoliative toxin A/B